MLAALPGDSSDPHAAEVAVARLRDATGSRELIRTVVKRGYRLEVCDPPEAPSSRRSVPPALSAPSVPAVPVPAPAADDAPTPAPAAVSPTSAGAEHEPDHRRSVDA